MRMLIVNKRHNLMLLLPPILWLAVIFFLSSQTGEDTTSLSLTITRWLARFFPGVAEETLHLWLRKLAHIAVYFVEGALLLPALLRRTRRPIQSFILTLALSVLIAVMDEAHKMLIPGRHCSWPEAALNVFGAALGAGFVLAIGKLKMQKQ